MPDSPTVDSPDAAAALGRLLYEFPVQSRNAGGRLHRSGLVAVERTDDHRVTAAIEDRRRTRHVTLLRNGTAWAARCTCFMQPHCEHVFAAALAWMARLAQPAGAPPGDLDPTTAAALAASLHLPRRPTFRQQWEPVLAEKIGRPLAREEGAFLGHLSTLFHNFQQSGRITSWDLSRLGLRTNKSGEQPYTHVYDGWWDRPPRDPMELWQYVAHDIESSGQKVPEFLQPVTDTAAIRERVMNLARRQAVARWRERLHHLGQLAAERRAAPAADAAPVPFELRLRVTAEQWTLETRADGTAAWQPAPRDLLGKIAAGKAAALVAFEASPAVLAFLALCHDYYHQRYLMPLTPDQPAARELLRIFLQHRLARQLVVGPDGEPVKISAERVHWRLAPARRNEREFELKLDLPDGKPLPPSAIHLPGQPDWYLHAGVAYPGPPPLDHASSAGALIPLEALEDPDVLAMLRRMGTHLPPQLAARFVEVPLRPRIECALEVDFNGGELLTLQLTAQAEQPPAFRTWTPQGWVAPEHAATPLMKEGKIAALDFAAADAVADHLPRLGLGFDAYRLHWTRRLTRNFPEEFLAWREALPAGVEVLATGELASLLGGPIRATIDFNLIESPAHRDWFDLALALKPEDTTLTPEEIALLLRARGKLVRLPGKGWRRLRVEIEGAAATALESAGFDRASLAEAALAGEKQRFHALQLAQSGVADALPEKQAAALRARAREIARPAPPPIPAGMRAELRPYQKEGFEFLAFLSANRLGGVLADDMGLGKTVQTLAWLLWLAETTGRERPRGEAGDERAPALRALVVCPKSVVGNWESETAKFAPEIAVVRFSPKGAQASPPASASGSRDACATLVVANYAQLRLNADHFTAERWDAVILDEGQFIKTPTSKVAQVARELPGDHRLILTGTPIENRLLDLWSLFAFAVPGLLGSQAAFKRHFAQDNALALPRLRARVRHFLLRRTKSQVAADLPARTEEDVFVELESEQQKLYQAELKRARAELLKVETARQFDRARFNILASLLRLRQICCHPALIDAAHRELPSAKLDDLLERLEELRDEGHQVLVFSQFVTMLELIREKLVAAEIGHLMLTGETENRDELVAQFQADKTRTVFLLSLKAAGFGLNLTAASYVVLYDPWWNPAVEAQAIDRTHRIGQSAPVIAYRLVARGTVEEKIRALQREKAALASAVVQEESLASVLDLESLRQILG